MSTRSVVARAAGDGFVDGVYVHWDGYPTARGPVLFDLERRHGLATATAAILGARNGGWSYLDPLQVGADAHGPGDNPLGDRGVIVPGFGLAYQDVPLADDQRYRSGGDLGWTEWVYAIDVEARTLTVFEVRGEAVPVAVVSFDDRDVDWEAIEAGRQPAMSLSPEALGELAEDD